MRRKGRCSIVVLMSLIEGLLPAQSCVVFIMHLATARHIALCRDAAGLRVVVESYRACLGWRPLPMPLRLHTHEPGCTRTARFHRRFSQTGCNIPSFASILQCRCNAPGGSMENSANSAQVCKSVRDEQCSREKGSLLIVRQGCG